MTPPKISIEAIERIFADAIMSDSFARTGARSGTWDVSRDCDKPVPVVLHSRATEQWPLAPSFVRKPGIELTMLVPCRRCRICLAKKARLWTYRAINESVAAPRTWFGTFTCRPTVHIKFDHVAATRERDFWSLSNQKKFELRVRVLGSEMTKYFKRLRKGGWQYRYLLVSEMHDSMDTDPMLYYRPHCHVLIHEVAGAASLTKRAIQAGWPHGFTNMKLVAADAGNDAAWYISKYINKANDARVRASIGYGSQECDNF